MKTQSFDKTEFSANRAPKKNRHLSLVAYDLLVLVFVDILLLGLNPSSAEPMEMTALLVHLLVSCMCVYVCRVLGGVYKQIWRYGSPVAYMRLIFSDAVAGVAYYLLGFLLPVDRILFIRAASVIAANLLIAISMRMIYQYVYEYANKQSHHSGLVWTLLKKLTGLNFGNNKLDGSHKIGAKIRIAIVGAGQVGVMLAEELLKNPNAAYVPCCFVDIDSSKVGRLIFNLPVISEAALSLEAIEKYSVQEIVFALPHSTPEEIKDLYLLYEKTGCKIKVYDFPIMQTAETGKRQMREFDIEELLFRKPVRFEDETMNAYYKNKIVLITGGGGSIGSELCRQVAKMQPKTLIILDICENGAYDIQQELRFAYGDSLDVRVEIVSVCDRIGIEKVMDLYHPHIILHAAAHKHVPLMEHNCCEAVKNNVFGTLNVVELAEKYGVERFIMVSTDKAVNPTNVMGATKRVCEMIVLSHTRSGSVTSFSATRFGNVLGSAASVVPLFKKQIKSGGPVTITDKRIIRYFMSISEASQLVLQSGYMAKNGELFVLDMGKSVKILELAENMIRLSGFEPYRDIDIIETGLRPGEKLYEELLIRSDKLEKTDNGMIFVERDEILSEEEINQKLHILRAALDTANDEIVKDALMRVVPTFHRPDDINNSEDTEEILQVQPV